MDNSSNVLDFSLSQMRAFRVTRKDDDKVDDTFVVCIRKYARSAVSSGALDTLILHLSLLSPHYQVHTGLRNRDLILSSACLAYKRNTFTPSFQ